MYEVEATKNAGVITFTDEALRWNRLKSLGEFNSIVDITSNDKILHYLNERFVKLWTLMELGQLCFGHWTGTAMSALLRLHADVAQQLAPAQKPMVENGLPPQTAMVNQRGRKATNTSEKHNAPQKTTVSQKMNESKRSKRLRSAETNEEASPLKKVKLENRAGPAQGQNDSEEEEGEEADLGDDTMNSTISIDDSEDDGAGVAPLLGGRPGKKATCASSRAGHKKLNGKSAEIEQTEESKIPVSERGKRAREFVEPGTTVKTAAKVAPPAAGPKRAAQTAQSSKIGKASSKKVEKNEEEPEEEDEELEQGKGDSEKKTAPTDRESVDALGQAAMMKLLAQMLQQSTTTTAQSDLRGEKKEQQKPSTTRLAQDHKPVSYGHGLPFQTNPLRAGSVEPDVTQHQGNYGRHGRYAPYHQNDAEPAPFTSPPIYSGWPYPIIDGMGSRNNSSTTHHAAPSHSQTADAAFASQVSWAAPPPSIYGQSYNYGQIASETNGNPPAHGSFSQQPGSYHY